MSQSSNHGESRNHIQYRQVICTSQTVPPLKITSIVSPVSSFMHIECQIIDDSQQHLLLSLATHGVMLFITCKRLAQWHLDNESYSAARKQDDQWFACITPADIFIDNEGSLMTIKDLLIQSISLQQLLCISVHFKIDGYRNRTKMIMITLIENRLKTLDCRDIIGYNKNSSKEPKMYLKRNGTPFTPESCNEEVSSPKTESEKKRRFLNS